MPTTTKLSHPKNALNIRLAESVVFLRAGDATGRQRSIPADASPGMVRGLLVLTLAKPTKVTSIEVELVGKTSTAWPEGAGAKRIEITEEHDIYSQSYVFFRAGHSPGTTSRRNLSVGPGLALEHEDEDHSEQSSIQHESQAEEHRGRSPPPRAREQNTVHRRYMSVDQTHFQRSFVAHREDTYPSIASPPYSPTYSPDETPLHLSPTTSISHRAPFAASDESPARSHEDLRRTMDAEHFSSFTRSPYRSTSSLWSPREAPESQRASLDEDRGEFQVGSSTTASQVSGPSRLPAPDSRTSSRHREAEGEDAGRGRKGKRFSFASALLGAMKDRVRSRSPFVEQDQGLSGYTTPPRGRTRDRSLPHFGDLASVVTKEPSALGPVPEVPSPEVGDRHEYGDGWKEFRKGVYTYPISFAIPANAPPTLHVDYGSVTWSLKAVVHRPGAFTTKLTASQDITVVATPGEDDTEDSESIIVERQWDTQMQYLIVISGRAFAIGGTMPITLTFMPWTKMKVHRISVIIEERVDYWTGFKRVARTDPNNRISLLSVKHPKKDGPAILPLDPDDPDAFRQSPLFDVVGPDEDLGQVMSGLMGPGPWTIKKELRLPKSTTILHTTNKNRRSNIFVSHMLKIVFRVERGDDSAVDTRTGKRKLFDIVVQTPVHILSHLCNPEHISLPPYSQLPDISSALAQALSNSDASAPRPPLDSVPSAGSIPHRRSASVSALAHHHPSSSTPAPAPSVESVVGSACSAEHPAGTTAIVVSPPLSRRPSFHEHTTPELFERLIAGQESVEGEAPPSYEVAVEGAGPSSVSSAAAVH